MIQDVMIYLNITFLFLNYLFLNHFCFFPKRPAILLITSMLTGLAACLGHSVNSSTLRVKDFEKFYKDD